ncbi:MAG: hypothetical protein VX961_00850, partial [Verrucomicrobiota bacterium]|nr:hypothetical protein [Verrucomicrobiota bacterium]
MLGRNRQFRRVYRENRFHPQQTHQKRTALSRLHFYSEARMARPKHVLRSTKVRIGPVEQPPSRDAMFSVRRF